MAIQALSSPIFTLVALRSGLAPASQGCLDQIQSTGLLCLMDSSPKTRSSSDYFQKNAKSSVRICGLRRLFYVGCDCPASVPGTEIVCYLRRPNCLSTWS